MKYFIAITLTFLIAKGNAQNNPDAILGKWESTEKNLIVEVYKQDNDLKARVLWFYDPDDTITPIAQRLDVNNPKEELRNRKIIGLDVLSGLTYNAKQNKWTGGKIYDSSSGKTWDANVWLTSPEVLRVKGFYLVRWFGKTLNFTKLPAD